jgi:hypothetical protein
MLFVSIGSYARENLWDSDFDFDKGKIVNGVFTVTDASTGTVMTVTNASYVHYYNASIGDWYNCFLRFKNKGNVTITFKFPNSHLTYRGIDGETNTGLTKWGSGSGNTKALNNATFTPVAGQENTYSFTFSGCDNMKIEQVFLNWCLGPDDFVGPEGVTKTYTGWSQTLYKYNSTPNVCPYGQWGGALCNLKFKETTSATDKGSYTLHWYVEEYSGFTNYSKSKGGLDWMYGLGFGSADNPVGTITSEIIGYQMTDVVAPTAKELVYTGEPQALVTAATSSRGTAMYKLSTESAWSTTIPSATDAGSYTVLWYMKSNQTAYEDYEPDAEHSAVSVTIGKVDIPDYTPPTALTQTYTTSGGDPVMLPLVSGGSATGGEMWYRIGTDGEWTQNPQASATGDYTVYWYVKGDKNHNDLIDNTVENCDFKGYVTAKICKASYDMNGITWSNATFTYDGQPHQNEVTLSNLPGGGLLTATYTCSGPEGNAINAGTYTVTATFTTTATNYLAPAPVSTTLTINPFNLQGAVAVVDNDGKVIPDQTYTGADIILTGDAVPGLKIGSNGLVIPTDAYDIAYLNNLNAGTAMATTYANGHDPNYTGSCALNFIIKKRSVEVSTAAQEIIYGEAISSSAVKASLVGAAEGHTLSAVTLKQVDNYSVSATPYPNAISAENAHIKDGSGNDVTDNYEISYPVGLRGSLTVNAKAGTNFTISGLKEEYEGNGISEVAPNGDIAVYNGTTKLTMSTDYDVTYSNNIFAGTATATFNFKGNYSGTTTKEFTIYYLAATYSRKSAASYNYCTYYHPTEALQAENSAKVYYCTLINGNSDVLLTEVTNNVINVGVPVMLRTPSTSNSVKLYKYTGDQASYSGTNALTGVSTDQVGTSINAADKIYIFEGDCFVWASGSNFMAHKAYIDASGWGSSYARILICSPDENTTGLIPTDDGRGKMEDVWYDMMGNRINKPTRKGLYIKNGKKVLVKTSGRAERRLSE